MCNQKSESFTFVILTYNHKSYIIEHLESVKYQIEEHGSSYSINIIIADDNSSDGTLDIVKKWLDINKFLFSKIDILENSINKGTCSNYVKTWEKIETSYFKVLAGDDLYSFSNIIDFSKETKNYHFISGIPLILEDTNIYHSKSAAFNMVATSEIYKKDFYKAMRCFSAINTPSLIYHKDIIDLEGLSDFIRQYDVVEDFPMQIKVCELSKDVKYHLSNEVYIYYRRTSNSTYIIKNNRFINDKTRQFEYLASMQKSLFSKLLIKNRILCLKLNNGKLKLLINLNTYIYIFRVMMKLVKILSKYKAINIDLIKHRQHYIHIKTKADYFLDEYSDVLV